MTLRKAWVGIEVINLSATRRRNLFLSSSYHDGELCGYKVRGKCNSGQCWPLKYLEAAKKGFRMQNRMNSSFIC